MATTTRTPGRRTKHNPSDRHTDIEERLTDIQRDLDRNQEAADTTSDDNGGYSPDDPYYGSLLEVAARTRRHGPPPIDPNLPVWSQVLNAILDHGGVTPNELGDRMGVSRQAVYAWQVGKIADMGTNRLSEIADTLGVPAYLFLTDPETAKAWIDQEYYASTPSPWNAGLITHFRDVGEQIGKAAHLSSLGASEEDLEAMMEPQAFTAWLGYRECSPQEELRRAS